MDFDKIKGRYQYFSWISNVSGLLQFHLTDIANYRLDRIVGDIFCHNDLKKQDRSQGIFASLLVDLRDEYHQNSSIFTRVFFLAQQHNDPSNLWMEGTICLIDYKQKTWIYKTKIEQQFLQKMSRRSPTPSDIAEIQNFYNDKKSYRLSKIEFLLLDTGLLLLRSDSNNKDIKTAYFVLKFLFHRDRFHKRSAENIVPILDLSDSIDNDTMTRDVWRHMVKYVSEQRKNNHSPMMLSELDGVLGYIEAFLSIMSNNGLCDRQISNALSTNTKNLAISLKVELEKKPPKYPTFYQLLEDFRLIAFVSILIMAILRFYSYLLPDTATPVSFTIVKYLPHTAIGFLTAIFVSTLLLTLVFQLGYNRALRGTYFENIFMRPMGMLVRFLKTQSRPNTAPKYRICQKYILPTIFGAEMFFRRDLKWVYKGLLLMVLTLAAFTGTVYFATSYYPPTSHKHTTSIVSDHNGSKAK